jgi:hypothetical protein
MIDKEDNFNEFLRQKVEESHFEYNEAYWLKAEKLINNAQPKRRPFWWGFGWGILSLALVGGSATLIWNNNQQKVSAENIKTAPVLQANFKQANTKVASPSLSNTDVSTLAASSHGVDYKQHQNKAATLASTVNAIRNNATKSKTNSNVKNSGVIQNQILDNSANENELAKASNSSNGSFSKVKVLSLPKLPESNITEFEEETADTKVITIAEPIVMYAKKPSLKDIDVNIVAACENKNKHEWMFGVLGGVSDSRGFEGNTVSNSTIGFGYFGGLKLAYKLDKNWFVSVQPLLYSRGAINTSIETEKTAYDFGANADEFVVKNKALVFSELPISIGYRLQRHQISVGAGVEYLVNVKSDVKEFGTDTYTSNQWGYTEGFNRVGAMAIFNYSFNVYKDFWLTMMVQKGFTDMTKADYFTTNSVDKNLNLRIGIQYLLINQKKKGK